MDDCIFRANKLSKQFAEQQVLRTITKAGRALLVSIHTLPDAERICERFSLLNRGQAVGYGTLDELGLQANLSAGTLEDISLALT